MPGRGRGSWTGAGRQDGGTRTRGLRSADEDVSRETFVRIGCRSWQAVILNGAPARRGIEGSRTVSAVSLLAIAVWDPSTPRLAGAPFRMADAAASTVRDLLIPHGALAQNDKAGAARLGLPRPA